MSQRITHANPKGLELGTSEQQIVLAKDAVGAKKPPDFGPAVNTFKIKISLSALPVFARCQFPSQETFCLSREGTWGQEQGQPVASGCSSCALPSSLHLAACPCDAKMLNPCPRRGLEAAGRKGGPGCACRCSGRQEGAALSQPCSPARRVPLLPKHSLIQGFFYFFFLSCPD